MWLVVKLAELVLEAVAVETGVEIAYHTVLSAGSLVVQTILVVVLAVLVADIPDITGAVVSGAESVVKDCSVDVPTFPDASLD